NMLAAGNTVVFNAHPSGARVAAEGGPGSTKPTPKPSGSGNPPTSTAPPTRGPPPARSDPKGGRPPVAPGGPPAGRPALASKKRAIVAGPGNPPVVVDATACLEKAARSIITGGAFDNNLLCIGEKQVFAVAQIFDGLMEEMSRHGGVRLVARQVEALTQ